MPKLKVKSDGGYYTTTVIDGSFVTYQIAQEGVSILRTLGYRDGDIFDKETLQHLINSEYAYTLGRQEMECYDEAGQTRLIAKPEKNPDVHHDVFGWGWVYEDPGDTVDVLFRQNRSFVIKTIISDRLDFAYDRCNYADLTRKYYKHALNSSDPEVKIGFAMLALDALDDRLKREHIKKYRALERAILSYTGHPLRVTRKSLRKLLNIKENLNYDNSKSLNKSVKKAMEIVEKLIGGSGYQLD